MCNATSCPIDRHALEVQNSPQKNGSQKSRNTFRCWVSTTWIQSVSSQSFNSYSRQSNISTVCARVFLLSVLVSRGIIHAHSFWRHGSISYSERCTKILYGSIIFYHLSFNTHLQHKRSQTFKAIQNYRSSCAHDARKDTYIDADTCTVAGTLHWLSTQVRLSKDCVVILVYSICVDAALSDMSRVSWLLKPIDRNMATRTFFL